MKSNIFKARLWLASLITVMSLFGCGGGDSSTTTSSPNFKVTVSGS